MMTMKASHSLAARRSRGFSMIELMVALVVGLMLTMAASQLLVTNKMTMTLQRQLGDVQDNGRFALDFMASQLRQAGFNKFGSSGLAPVAFMNSGTSADVMAATNSSGVAVYVSKDGGGTNSDSLTIQFYSGDGDTASTGNVNTNAMMTDCTGNTVPRGQFVVERFYIGVDSVTGNKQALLCDGGYYSSTAGYPVVTLGNNQPIALVENVDNFQVLYGVDGTVDGIQRPTEYMNATQYLTANPSYPGTASPIVAVSISMLVHSNEQTTKKDTSTTPAYQLLDVNLPAGQFQTSGYVRRIYQTTVSLRNVSQGSI